MSHKTKPSIMRASYFARATFISASIFAIAGISGFAGSEALAAPSPDQLEALEYRLVGPLRGGRVTTVAGVDGNSLTYYMGATGGGVWKTTNAGEDWENVSDGFFEMGSVGAIDVSNSDPNVVVVGMGESPVRGVASSIGDGVYISTDAGRTWAHAGLTETRQISRIVIHPTNPDIIYVAAQGNTYRPTEERGIYRSTDGGETWERLHFVNETTGAVDLKMDATNPRILYASMWDHRRQPWEVRSGGEGSGLYKSTDGGESWTKLSGGLPEEIGKAGIAPSPANPDRVWAIVESREKGGLYRSDDAGESWSLVNDDRRLHARSWYYMHIEADTKDPQTVYVMNSGMYRSDNGGGSITPIFGDHGDYHATWINPDNNRNMIIGNDGGAQVSFDGGASWSTLHNQPTAQFYRVNVDNLFPYNIYAGQQDNSAIRVRSRGLEGLVGADDYQSIGGCESGFVSFNPDDPRFVYAGCYLGNITEYDDEEKRTRDVRAYPEFGFGVPPRERKYRFNWNAPIIVSEHDPEVIYHAGNQVLMSRDRGQTWTEKSPDLTRDTDETQGPGGRPHTIEVSENYNTIAYLKESPHDADVLWAGTDDGLVQLTRDGGETWTDITPRGVEDGLFNAIDTSPHTPGKAYVAYTRYKYGDFTPVAYRVTDYGRRWTEITDGFAEDDFVRVVREDTVRPGLLYAGTETGLYFSMNDGEDWHPLENNLPDVPVTDIKVHGDDLVISTQGRAFWVLEDLNPLRQWDDAMDESVAHLFAPKPAFDMWMGGGNEVAGLPNPADGATLDFWIGEETDLEDTTVTLEILDSNGMIVHTKSTEEGDGVNEMEVSAGLNRVNWNLNGPDFKIPAGMFTYVGSGDTLNGYTVPPGDYTVRLTVGEATMEQPLTVTQDPRSPYPNSAWDGKYGALAEVQDALKIMGQSMLAFESASAQVKALTAEANTLPEAVQEAGEALVTALSDWRSAQTSGDERTFFQDVLNWPDKLFEDLQFVYADLDGSSPPLTAGPVQRWEDLKPMYEAAISERDAVINGELEAFNTAWTDAGLPAVVLPEITVD